MTDAKKIGLARGLTHYGDADFSLYLRRTFGKAMGYSNEMLKRAVVGIAHSSSGFDPCDRTTPELVDAIKRGVAAAGGLPLDLPSISLGEPVLTPTSMKFRNLMSMDIDEMIRAQPMDAAVLVGGCDKSLAAQLMGAASADVQAI